MIAPGVNNPESRNAWNPTIFTVNGSKSNAASASRRIHRHTTTAAKTMASINIIYLLSISSLMNANASGVPYMSAVGAGNMPVTPRIGMMRSNERSTLQIMSMTFFIGKMR